MSKTSGVIAMKKALLALGLAFSSLSFAADPLTFSNAGLDGQTTIFKASLGIYTGKSFGSVNIVDSNSQSGGSTGVFSGFDLDFVSLDLDGNYATAGDRQSFSSFAFLTGAIREPVGIYVPTVLHPGPTIGSSAANTIDSGWATLGTRDGVYPGNFNTDNVSGWLTLGDGGSLWAGLASAHLLTGTEALFIGEVGNSVDEFVNANVTFSAAINPVPEPETYAMMLAGLGLLGVMTRRRKQKAVA